MAERILVPMDGSPLSEQALAAALEEHPDADIAVLHVIDPTEPGYSYYPVDGQLEVDYEPRHGSEEWYARAEEYAEELFESARDRAGGYDVTLRTELVVGSPGRAIVEYARDNDVDQVFIGSHGRGEDAAILLGSVTETVAFRSPVRVNLIR